MMESVKEIGFSGHDCMCWEEDAFGHPLCCLPFECEIEYCPIKKLIAIIQTLHRKASEKT